MTALLIKLITIVLSGVGSVLWRNYRYNKRNNMRIIDTFGTACKNLVIDSMAQYAKAWLAENTESEETETEVAVSFGTVYALIADDFAGTNWSTTPTWGGPIPPRPPAA